MSLLFAALAYAGRGFAVFPLLPRSKTPATAHGYLDATVHQDQIIEWWTANPDYNVAIATGESNLAVVDIDPRNGGMASWLALHPDEVHTATAETGGGGLHYLFRGAGKYRPKLAEGVDVKSYGGYIVAPPSIHPDGGTYRWIREDVQPVPDWLAELLAKPEREPSAPVEYDPNDNRPGSRFIRDSNWPDLMTGWGYKECGTGVDGQVFWTRPGKDSGISAVTGGETDTLYVFSSSTAFEAGKPYNRFSAYVHMEFDGDFSRAASVLSDRSDSGIVTLTERDAERLVEILDSPPAPTQAFKDAAQRVFGREVTPETEYAFLFGVS